MEGLNVTTDYIVHVPIPRSSTVPVDCLISKALTPDWCKSADHTGEPRS